MPDRKSQIPDHALPLSDDPCRSRSLRNKRKKQHDKWKALHAGQAPAAGQEDPHRMHGEADRKGGARLQRHGAHHQGAPRGRGSQDADGSRRHGRHGAGAARLLQGGRSQVGGRRQGRRHHDHAQAGVRQQPADPHARLHGNRQPDPRLRDPEDQRVPGLRRPLRGEGQEGGEPQLLLPRRRRRRGGARAGRQALGDLPGPEPQLGPGAPGRLPGRDFQDHGSRRHCKEAHRLRVLLGGVELRLRPVHRGDEHARDCGGAGQRPQVLRAQAGPAGLRQRVEHGREARVRQGGDHQPRHAAPAVQAGDPD